MGAVYQRPAARRDLIEHYIYLIEHADEAVADRFLSHAEAGFNDLSDQPMIGSRLATRNPLLSGIRKWRIKDFDNHLIFYLPRPDGVSIVRVLHAAQDWWGLLEIEN